MEVGCHNKIKFQHVNFQERGWWKNHITTCSPRCHSHQKTDQEGQRGAKAKDKIALALKLKGWPTKAHRATTGWSKAKKITRPWPEFTFLRKLAESNQKRFWKSLVSVLKKPVLVIQAPLCPAGQRLWRPDWKWKEQLLWDGWSASLIQWTWVRANSGRWWRTEKPGVLQSVGSQRVGQDWITTTNNSVIVTMFEG